MRNSEFGSYEPPRNDNQASFFSGLTSGPAG